MRILALVVPRLSIQLARREAPALVGRPAATVQVVDGEALVAVPSVEAAAAGVQAGMVVAEALGRCPALVTVPARPARELEELERLAEVLSRKATPRVALLSREAVGVDLRGLEARFAGEAAAATALLQLARGWLGMEVRAGVADSPGEALRAARCTRRGLVVCEARGPVEGLPPRPTFAARVTCAGGVSAARCEAAILRLGLVLRAHGVSCRGIDVAAWTADGEVVALQRVAAEPVHSGEELLALAPPLLGRVAGAEEIAVRVVSPGPSVEVAPWRPAVARRSGARGMPAVPVQRRLALAG